MHRDGYQPIKETIDLAPPGTVARKREDLSREIDHLVSQVFREFKDQTMSPSPYRGMESSSSRVSWKRIALNMVAAAVIGVVIGYLTRR